MTYNYEINPCQACITRYGIDDINSLNSCCVETAGAFAGQSSTNALVGTQAGGNCDECLRASKAALGRSDCDFRLTKAPIWSQTPHFFPDLMAETGDKNRAYMECQSKCESVVYPEECKLACWTDGLAVVSSPIQQKIKETYTAPEKRNGKKRFVWPYSWKVTWIVLIIVLIVAGLVGCLTALC